MKGKLSRGVTITSFLLSCAGSLAAAQSGGPTQKPTTDLSDYRTAETAIATRVSMAGPGRTGQAGYLGIRFAADQHERLVVAEVQPDSPAAKAGLQKGDTISRVDDQVVTKAEALRESLLARSAGETVKLTVLRNEKPLDMSVTLGAVSRPMRLNPQRAVLGIVVGDSKDGEGAPVERIQPDSPAAQAGLKTSDIILKINNAQLTGPSMLNDLLAERKPGDTLALLLRRDGKETEVKVQLGDERFTRGRFGTRETAPLPLWKKDLYRLAVVGIEYPDVKHNAKITKEEWEQALFSRNQYSKKENATGQPVHGSLNDYFQEQSYGAFRIEGKVFDWVEVGKKRGDYQQGSGTSNRSALLIEALDKLVARDGKEALKDFDGLFFIYAGDPVRTNRGALYYPHSGGFLHQGKRWSYLLTPEGGSRMTTISGFCREFAYLLGLPDLAARTENAGSEGCGVWCALSGPLGNGRPQHLCAWSKETLGWVKPTVLDPTVKQKLILAPIEDSAKECFKILVRADGSEYFLLENRRRKGFDTDLPAEGLLIWRVVNDRPVLEESHGVEGASGPRVFQDLIPYPSSANNAFTPYTTPSSRSLRGGLPVYITEIRQLRDGRIAFQIGYDYQ
jgi:M6 family metalloprotease-like protein